MLSADAVAEAVVGQAVDDFAAFVVAPAEHAPGRVVGVAADLGGGAAHGGVADLHAVAAGVKLVADGELLAERGAAAGVKAGIGRHAGQPALVVVDVGLAALHQAVLAEGLAGAAALRVVAVVGGLAERQIGDADLLAGRDTGELYRIKSRPTPPAASSQGSRAAQGRLLPFVGRY